MDKRISSIETIDLTENDEPSERNAQVISDSAACSLPSIPLQSTRNSASHLNVQPIILDLTDDPEYNHSSRKVAIASGDAKEISKSRVCPPLDQSSVGRPESIAPKSCATIQNSVETNVKEAHSKRPPTSTAFASWTSENPVDRYDEKGNGKATAKSAPSDRGKSTKSPLPGQRKFRVPKPLIQRQGSSSITPQKRKQSLPGHSSEQPVFRTPSKIEGQANIALNLVDAPASRTSPQSTAKADVAQSQSTVHVKQEENDQEAVDEIPDYLGPTRTRGWHHNGYADVKTLFQKIALDAVHKEEGHYKDQPIDIETTTHRVREKAEKLASKKFGYFVNRLKLSSTSVPNANDVEWLQRKVSEAFSKEANRAASNLIGQNITQELARAESPDRTNNSAFPGQVSGEARTTEIEKNHETGPGPLPSKPAQSLPAPPATSTLPNLAAPFESNRRSSNVNLGSRPSRAAAGTAASRITSQYATGNERPASEFKTPGITFDRQLCPDCNCWISVHNFRVHLGSQKHKNIARQAEAEQEYTKQDEALEGKTRRIPHLNTAPTLEPEPEQCRLRPNDRDFTIPSTMTLQPQRRALQESHQKALAASLAIRDSEVFRPYQGQKKRGTIDNTARLSLLDQGVLLQHVDFTADEIAMVKRVALRSGNGALKIAESLANAYADPDSILMGRDKQALVSQIQSLDNVSQQFTPVFTTIESRVKDPNVRPACCLGSLLRHRELGSSATGRRVETQSELKIRITESIRPWRSFTGASHDVVTVAWAPNSMGFAAGAVAHSNSEDLQYNRPCNLLLGDLLRNTLTELPDHRIDRQKLEAGPNSSQDMFNACDPKVYKTVTSVKFHAKGNQMYTASEDQTVKIWDLSDSGPECTRTLRHDASVTGLDISPFHSGAFATASQKIKNAIRVFGNSGGSETLTFFSSSRALMKPEWKLYPESLHWGPSASSSHLLLGGFQDYGHEVDNSTEGHLCLWDINTAQDLRPTPASQAIHTAAWHPTLPYFASGGAPGLERTNRQTTKTVLRAWDLHYPKRLAIEYECPAREMTDVTFCPLDRNIVTAGCTNSISYVWDWRWPEQPLHQLRHSKSVMPTGERDTGIMMSLWGIGSSLYYTGSSDGSIRAWDIRRHPNDALVNTVAQLDAGIQSGAFSPDGSHLLVGDATGGIHVLSSAPWEPRPCVSIEDDARTSSTPMTLIRAPYGSQELHKDDDNPGTEGIETGHELLRTGQLILDPVYGPGKGPNYNGPFALQDREFMEDSYVGRLTREVCQQQPFSRSGDMRPERANPIRKLAAARKESLGKAHKDDAEVEIESLPRAPGIPKSPDISVNGPANLMSRVTSEKASGAVHTFNMLINSFQTNDKEAHLPVINSSIVNNSVPKLGGQPVHVKPPKHFAIRSQPSFMGLGVIDNVIPESEMVEENDWWPQLGEKEIAKAFVRPGMRKG